MAEDDAHRIGGPVRKIEPWNQGVRLLPRRLFMVELKTPVGIAETYARQAIGNESKPPMPLRSFDQRSGCPPYMFRRNS